MVLNQLQHEAGLRWMVVAADFGAHREQMGVDPGALGTWCQLHWHAQGWGLPAAHVASFRTRI